MLPGPVFAAELMTTARRARYYALRMMYGMVLLVVFWASYRAFDQIYGNGRETFTPGQMSTFAKQTFDWFAIAQALTVLVITPALVAGTIAGEKQRKTLHYLLASQLSSGEIVIGKLLARMLMIFVYLLAGVPLLFLLMLFGGVEIELILATFGVTVTFALFIASVSIFFSTVMRQARSAIVMSYVSLVVCFLMPYIARESRAIVPDWLSWLLAALDYISPMINLAEYYEFQISGTLHAWVVRMVVAQWIYSVILLVYSTRSLRRIAASQTAQPKVILRLDSRGRPMWRALPRPAVGDDPMLWKERYTARVGGVAKMLGLFNNLFWAVLIGCLTFDYARTAILEVIERGYGDPNRQHFQGEFNTVLRAITPWVAGFWLLGTATTAASSIASEREDDTWISLIASDLEGKEILRAKLLGSILRFRWMGLMLLTMWALGVTGGAIHPLGFAAATVELAVFLWFAAILGLRFSLLSSSTSKSLAMTLGCFIFCNVGYLLCCLPLPMSGTVFNLMGVMPWLIREAIFSASDMQQFNNFTEGSYSTYLRLWADQPIVPSVLGVLVYALSAWFLTKRTYARFDTVVDRPRMSS
ncbi:MAG: hypothetical protein JWN86_940 [Planctomycetota bacterium]|nr:hypothetical protein [Planctomycetota bacterium]